MLWEDQCHATAVDTDNQIPIIGGKTHSIHLPGMGGHRCVQELLKIDSNAKIIIASGYSVAGEIKKTLEA